MGEQELNLDPDKITLELKVVVREMLLDLMFI